MKNILRKGAVIVVVLTILLSFTACISTDDAKMQVDEFLSYLSEGSYDDAAELLHPDSGVSSDDLRGFVVSLIEAGISLSDGIRVENYYSYHSSFYDSDVDGSALELGAEVTVDGYKLDMTVIFVDNDAGYGIYYFGFDA